MNFRASFCDPFKSDIIEIGEIEKDKIMEHFESIPWTELIEIMLNYNGKTKVLALGQALDSFQISAIDKDKLTLSYMNQHKEFKK